jgi:hypothetical protein
MPGHTGKRSCGQKLFCFHVLSWTISRSPAWTAASDKERKSQICLIFWWRRVQPQQDELMRLQIAKLRREIAGLDRQLK